jgi:hypothetical protein
MAAFRLMTFMSIVFCGSILGFAQSDLLEKIRKIVPLGSTKSDVLRLFGRGSDKDNSTWYYFPEYSLEITYSNGACRRSYLTERDNVVEVYVNFLKNKKLSGFKRRVNVAKVRKEKSLDVEGERYYYDDKNGIEYGVNEALGIWFSILYFPAEKYSGARCSVDEGEGEKGGNKIRIRIAK